MGPIAKTGKLPIGALTGALRCDLQKHQSAIWNRAPPTCILNRKLQSCVQDCSLVTNTCKQNGLYHDSFKSFCQCSDFRVATAQGGGAGEWGVSGVISYSLYEFQNVQR